MRAIICEGKTDAILVGYFLSGTYGWTFQRDRPPLELPFDRHNEEMNWFAHPAKGPVRTVVWGAGGIDQIGPKLRHIAERTRVERRAEHRFEFVVLFFDRDQRSDADCHELIEDWLDEAELVAQEPITIGAWVRVVAQLEKVPQEEHQLYVIAVVVPHDAPGGLEAFLLGSLERHSDDDARVVRSAREYVAMLPRMPYLGDARLRPKAILGAALSVFSPDWVFGDLDQRLTAVQWADVQMVAAEYQRFGDL